MRSLSAWFCLLGMLGYFSCALAAAAVPVDEKDVSVDQNRTPAKALQQRSKSEDRQTRRARFKALTKASYGMLEQYALSDVNPEDWTSLLAAESIDDWKVKGDARRLDDQWILGGEQEAVVEFKTDARQAVILSADVQCEKSKDPFSQPRLTFWFRDKETQRIRKSEFSLAESSASGKTQAIQIVVRYDAATRQMCTAQIAGKNRSGASSFPQMPVDLVAIGFTVPAGAKLRLYRLEMYRPVLPGVENSTQLAR